jgi:hypothetical protein
MKSNLFEFAKTHWLWIQHPSGIELNITEIFQIDGGLIFKNVSFRRPDDQPMRIIPGIIKKSIIESDTWIIELDQNARECLVVRELTKSKRLLWNERMAWERLRRSAGAKWSHYQGRQMDFRKQIRFAMEEVWRIE